MQPNDNRKGIYALQALFLKWYLLIQIYKFICHFGVLEKSLVTSKNKTTSTLAQLDVCLGLDGERYIT